MKLLIITTFTHDLSNIGILSWLYMLHCVIVKSTDCFTTSNRSQCSLSDNLHAHHVTSNSLAWFLLSLNLSTFQETYFLWSKHAVHGIFKSTLLLCCYCLIPLLTLPPFTNTEPSFSRVAMKHLCSYLSHPLTIASPVSALPFISVGLNGSFSSVSSFSAKWSWCQAKHNWVICISSKMDERTFWYCQPPSHPSTLHHIHPYPPEDRKGLG